MKIFEIFFVSLVIIISIFLAKFPTYYHVANKPDGYTSIGHASWFDGWDINIYIANMRYAQREGTMLLENVYTTLEHSPAFIYQFYTSLGIINSIFNIPPVLLFHSASIISSFILILSTFWLTSLFFKNRILRVFAFMTAVIGAGFGWIPGLTYKSGDLIYAGLTTTNAFERGHDALSTAAFITTLGFFIQFLKTNKKQNLIAAIISAMVNLIIHPTFIVLYIIIFPLFAISDLIRHKRFNTFVYIISVGLLFSIYYLLSLSKAIKNTGFGGVVGQELPDVSLPYLVLGFGLLGFFILCSYLLFRKNKDEIILIKITFITQILLLFSPIGFNLHFLKGLFILGSILAFFAISKMINKFKIVCTILIFLILSSSFLSRIYVFSRMMNVSTTNPFFFISNEEHEALKYLSNLPKDSTVLALYYMGNLIPAHTDNRVYFGHGLQTPNGDDRLRLASYFYTYMAPNDRLDFLSDSNVEYVYYGQEESKLRSNSGLETVFPFENLDLVFENDQTLIYKYKKI